MKATSLKRNPHSYKCIDKVYKKANLRVRKLQSKGVDTSLAEIIERFVISYSEGNLITASKVTDSGIRYEQHTF